MDRPQFLMCPPKHYSVDYTINPWMNPDLWKSEETFHSERAEREWQDLYEALISLGAGIDLVAPSAGVPDLVFAANAAVVMDGTALLARFRHPERQCEQPHYASTFRDLVAKGLLRDCVELPGNLTLEGAGDCIWDGARRMFWVGSGSRSSPGAATIVEETFGLPTVRLDLADPRFYHLDTTFSVLSNGEIMYFPAGLTASARRALYERVGPDDRLEVGEEDACCLALNGICLGDTIVLAACSDSLRSRLTERSYRVVVKPLASFMLSGGAAYCLTLRTNLVSRAHPGQARASA